MPERIYKLYIGEELIAESVSIETAGINCPYFEKKEVTNNAIPYNNDRDELINLNNVLSFMVGLENMQENRLQSAQNDVQMANDKQAKYLLEEINRRFDEQNAILTTL